MLRREQDNGQFDPFLEDFWKGGDVEVMDDGKLGFQASHMARPTRQVQTPERADTSSCHPLFGGRHDWAKNGNNVGKVSDRLQPPSLDGKALQHLRTNGLNPMAMASNQKILVITRAMQRDGCRASWPLQPEGGQG